MGKQKIEMQAKEETPVGLYDYIYYNVLYKLAVGCGLNFLKPGYIPHLRTYLQFYAIILFFVFFLGMTVERDISIVLQCCCCLNFCFQGIVKYATVMIRHEKIHANILQIGHIYKSNTIRDTPNYLVLLRWGAYGGTMCRIIMSMCAFVGIFIFGAPIVLYFVFGEPYQIMVPVLLPLLNEKEPLGYWIMTGYHIGVLAMAMFGTAGADIMMISFVLHMWPMCLIFSNMLTDMNEGLQKTANQRSMEMRKFVRNIIMVHQELTAYNIAISDLYYLQCSIEVFTNAVSLCCGVFCILSMNWVQGYFIFMLNFAKLLAYCFLGTVAELTSDHILNALLESDYYLLPLREQRFLQLMIQMAEKPTILMAGNKILNLSLFIDTMKSVYSVAMLLAETVK